MPSVVGPAALRCEVVAFLAEVRAVLLLDAP